MIRFVLFAIAGVLAGARADEIIGCSADATEFSARAIRAIARRAAALVRGSSEHRTSDGA